MLIKCVICPFPIVQILPVVFILEKAIFMVFFGKFMVCPIRKLMFTFRATPMWRPSWIYKMADAFLTWQWLTLFSVKIIDTLACNMSFYMFKWMANSLVMVSLQ